MVCATTVLLAALLACAVASPLPKTTREHDVNNYRLPKTFIPDNYELHIKPSYTESGLMGIENFRGEVVIAGTIDIDEIKESFDEISFHGSNEMEIQFIDIVVSDVENSEEGTKEEENGKVNYDVRETIIKDLVQKSYNSTTEIYTYELSAPITKEELEEQTKEITLRIKYSSSISKEKLTGFYYSSFKYTGDGAEETDSALLVTQFEPIYARKAFPCLDEPSFRATFDLSITVQDEIEAISNTNIKNTSDNIIQFETTPKMSTYLLAFIIYETDSFTSTNSTSEEFTHKTWARIDAINAGEGELSQADGPRMILFMGNYTEQPYSNKMNKMDEVAVPDFQAGAMENWGLVIYREMGLLYNKETGSTAAHKRVSDILSHELAHQWFGNLVVTDWWDSIWLNEGFADYFEMLMMDNAYPNWRMKERFLLEEQMSVFSLDASTNSVPLTNLDVQTEDQINNHFGSITYKKGASIIRQISNVIGEENFQEAIRKYLDDRSLNSAKPEDLFKFFVETNHIEFSGLEDDDLYSALESWTLKKGFPVINVIRESGRFKVSQERFLETEETVADERPTYYVPLSWSLSNETADTAPKAPQAWLTDKQTTTWLTIDVSDDVWVLFNPWQSGYYRVNYDDETWEKIIQALKADASRVSPVDRAAIVDNLLTFARAGYVTYERALTGVEFLKKDDDFIPWAAARTALAHLDQMLGAESDYKRFIRDLVRPTYEKQNWDTPEAEVFQEDNVLLTHRLNVLTLACAAGHADCLNHAESHLKDDSVDKELESVIYCYGLKKNNSRGAWDEVWEEWDAAEGNPARRSLLTTALGCINDNNILKLYLERSLNTTFVPKKEGYTVFVAAYSNPDGVLTALEFLRSKTYDTIAEAYGDDAMSTILSGLARRLTTNDDKTTLAGIVKDKPQEDAVMKIVDENILWVNKFGESVQKTIGAAPVNIMATSIILLCATLLALVR